VNVCLGCKSQTMKNIKPYDKISNQTTSALDSSILLYATKQLKDQPLTAIIIRHGSGCAKFANHPVPIPPPPPLNMQERCHYVKKCSYFFGMFRHTTCEKEFHKAFTECRRAACHYITKCYCYLRCFLVGMITSCKKELHKATLKLQKKQSSRDHTTVSG
jgi:hypothetical protein